MPVAFTLVRHSAFGWGKDPNFVTSVQLAAVPDEATVERIRRNGGLVFASREEAERVASMTPAAPARFNSRLRIGGLALYLKPEREAA